ncbi:MAG: outer-membrane lipoprotein carrier protein LolA [Hyphomicrobiaceae bacterium]|nr:outer-membrane lipoprotein carrier protein LolA [Hyphomicrobiaceae bacterium]
MTPATGTIVSAIATSLVLALSASVAVAQTPANAGTAAPGGANPAGAGWSAQVAPGAEGLALDAGQTAAVKSVNGYFNGLKTLQGAFVQTGADGKVMKGNFEMMRPGMFRFDYAKPSKQIIISDGTNLAIQDHDLNNEDRVALDQTPFRVLLRSDVDLMRDAKIREVQDTGDLLLVALEDKSPDTPGRIKLVLAKSPSLQLKEWVTTDAQGLDTRVEVGELKQDAELKAERFVIKAVGNPFKQQ